MRRLQRTGDSLANIGFSVERGESIARSADYPLGVWVSKLYKEHPGAAGEICIA